MNHLFYRLLCAISLALLSDGLGIQPLVGGGGRQSTQNVMSKTTTTRRYYEETSSRLYEGYRRTSAADSGEGETRDLPTTTTTSTTTTDRRDFLSLATKTATVVGSALMASTTSLFLNSFPANANVGTLPEFAGTDAVLHGLTVNVVDKSQQNAMIKFMTEGLGAKVLRKRIKDNIEETWIGYGPEQLSIPNDFTVPVSSFEEYGGHASIHMVYDSRAKSPLYKVGDTTPPGDSIAYLQIAVPSYRISQMVANGGQILDAYGLVNVISPSGLPVRGIVGFVPDPIMYLAVNCDSVQASRAFYSQLGFVEQEYPYARPSKGTIFDPAPPSSSAYMSQSPNCMGVLLLQGPKKKKVSPNPVVSGLDVVYSPRDNNDNDDDNSPLVLDPSGVPITFKSVSKFEAEEKLTR